jgi:hypothetical protein
MTVCGARSISATASPKPLDGLRLEPVGCHESRLSTTSHDSRMDHAPIAPPGGKFPRARVRTALTAGAYRAELTPAQNSAHY